MYWPGGIFHEDFHKPTTKHRTGLDSNTPDGGPAWLEGVAAVDEDETVEYRRARSSIPSPRVSEVYNQMPYKDDV